MDLVSYWVVGFSGSRHLKQPESVGALIRDALLDLEKLADGQLVAVSSAAIGADLLFVEEAARRQIPWIAVLPFPEDYFFNEKDFPDEGERESARQRLTTAADCEIIRVPRDAEQAADSTWRRTAFAEGGFRCVDQCDVFIAVFHKTSEPAKRGGTGDVVAYAQASQRPLLIIDPETLEVTRDNWPIRLDDPLTDELKLLGNAPVDARAQAGLSTAGAVTLAGWRNAFARAARKHLPGIRWGNTAVVILHALATIITAMVFLIMLPIHRVGEGPPHMVITALEKLAFLFVVMGFGFLIWVVWKRPQVRAANYRFAAEIGRSVLAVWSLPGAALRILRSPPENFTHFVRSLVLHHRLDPGRPREASDENLSEQDIQELAGTYVRNRIEPQIKYYFGKHLKSHRAAVALEIASILFSAIAVISAGFLVYRGPSGWWGFAKLAAATLAPVALSMLVIHEVKRREARYREMHHMLKKYAQRIQLARSLSTLQDLVVDLEHLFVSETYEWWILAKENVAA